MVEVALFTAVAGHDIDRGVVVGRERGLGAFVSRGGDLADQTGLGAGASSGDDRVIHGLIDGDALFLQRVVEVDAGIGGTAGTAVIHRGCGREAEQGDLSGRIERERAVLVAKQDAAFDLIVDQIVLQCRAHFVLRGVGGRIVIRIVGDLLHRGKRAEKDI